jgi:chemotaxis protein MotB
VVHQFTRQGIDPLRLEIVGFGEFRPRQPNDTSEGRNANRRVVVLVLEEVSAGAPVTARTTDQTPASAAPGVDMADSSSAANRLMYQAPPAAVEKTVLMKDQIAPPANSQPKAE